MTTQTQDGSTRSELLRTLRGVFATPGVGPLLALIVAGIYFYLQNERFFTPFNISLILQQTSWIAALAIGQTLIILTAGIDLSNGLVMALGTVIMTTLAVQAEMNPVLALLIGFVVTIGFGVLNGVLVTQLNIPPFIVTLGTLNIAFALTRIVSVTTISGLPPLHTFFGERFEVFGTRFTYGSVAVVILYFIMWFILRETDFGRHVYAVGDDPEAARLMGIPVNRVLITVYGLSGLFYGIAGWILVGRIGSGDPNAGQTANLDSITAVVIGGTSLFGGRGSILGTLIGALIVGVFINGLQITGVDPLWQRFITGVLVILAVAIDQFSQRIR
ncbi:MAG: ABC transporter permease [Chloroflexota bacterium]